MKEQGRREQGDQEGKNGGVARIFDHCRAQLPVLDQDLELPVCRTDMTVDAQDSLPSQEKRGKRRPDFGKQAPFVERHMLIDRNG